jgi:hypothetical protein
LTEKSARLKLGWDFEKLTKKCMKVIQEEAMEVNEELRKAQSQVLHILGDV